jgi:hypothetical protein
MAVGYRTNFVPLSFEDITQHLEIGRYIVNDKNAGDLFFQW